MTFLKLISQRRRPVDGLPAAYVCRNHRCDALVKNAMRCPILNRLSQQTIGAKT